MNLSIIIKNEKDELGIYSNPIDINVMVNGISDIYPKISKKYRKTLKFEYEAYDKYNESGMDIFQLYDKVVEMLNQKIKDGNCEISIDSFSSNSFKRINEVFFNGCIIDITKVKDNEINSLLSNNKFNDKIKFKDKYNNYSLLSYNEVLNSYKLIDKMKREIKKYDLTPLEQIIFLYDKVRKKPYKAYDKDQSTSRDITEVLNNDYVVCEGYANVISAVCNALNINCEKILWKPFEGNIGHASNLVYINDDYYNVHQFFEIDAVVATKKNEKDYDYINNYKLFLLPLKYAVGIKEKYNNLTIGYKLGVEQLNDRYNTADRFKAIAAPDILTMNSIQLYLKGMMELANKIGNKELIQKCRKIESEFKNDSIDFEKVQKIHEEYQKLFIKKIKKDVMIEALYKVKRIEYLIDPNEYKLDIDSFKKMIDCNFPKSQEEKLLEVIFDDINGYFDNVKYLKTIDGNNLDEKVEKDIKRIEFLNILKGKLDSRKGKVNVKK